MGSDALQLIEAHVVQVKFILIGIIYFLIAPFEEILRNV